MITDRLNRTARPRSRRAGSQSRDLLIGLGVVACLGVLVISVVFLFSRTGSRPQIGAKQPVAHAELASTPPLPSVPAPRVDDDQRLFATRRAQESGEPAREEPDAAPEQQPSDTASDSQGSSAEPPQISAESSEDESNPRKLLRRVRRQVKAGDRSAALATSRKIVPLVEDPVGRSTLDNRIDQLEGADGAGQIVDFDSLIELIEETISPNSWASVGGAGTIESFAGGVYVDTGGLMKPRAKQTGDSNLTDVRHSARPTSDGADQLASLRKISLPRLEQEVTRRLAAGEPLTEELRYLAGLQEVRYVLVYPEERDVVLAGPADEWQTDAWGRAVGKRDGRPVIQLDDLVVILRTCFSDSKTFGLFGCGIYPRTERLQQVQEFINRSAAAGPIEPSQRNRWLAELRDQLGPQDIQVFGIHPGSRVAQVLVEADYRMKLIGIGLEPAAVPGIPSYFDLIGEPDDARLNRPLDTLRWWFILNFDAIVTNGRCDAFELRGSRVQVLSENELLTLRGERIHTGQSDPVNAEFARNFTDQFPALAESDVNFADLAGTFDLAVLCGLLRGHEIPKTIGWPMATFLDPDEYVVPLNTPPRTVETVINHRVYRGRHIMAAISGGVHVNPWQVVSDEKLKRDPAGTLDQLRSHSHPGRTSAVRWWWD